MHDAMYIEPCNFDGFPIGGQLSFAKQMVEAIATGKAVVTTVVGAAAELVDNGKNGYIVHSRDPRLFCDAMVKALSLDAHSYSLAKSRPYALSGLAEDLVTFGCHYARDTDLFLRCEPEACAYYGPRCRGLAVYPACVKCDLKGMGVFFNLNTPSCHHKCLLSIWMPN